MHIRRGDKLSARGKEAIGLPPASVIALALGRLARRHRLRSVLVLSDDADVVHDLAALLPHLSLTAIQLPEMAAVTNTSERHRPPRSDDVLSRKPSATAAVLADPRRISISGDGSSSEGGGEGAGGDDESAILRALEQHPPCGLPATGGHPALPRCHPLLHMPAGAMSHVTLHPPRVLELSRGKKALLTGPLSTSDADLGALLWVALWSLSRSRVLVASSASNIGTLLYTLNGFRAAVTDEPPTPSQPLAVRLRLERSPHAGVPQLVDSEAISGSQGHSAGRPETRRHEHILETRQLLEGKYFCRLDWGPRKFGLCRAGELGGRPAKTW